MGSQNQGVGAAEPSVDLAAADAASVEASLREAEWSVARMEPSATERRLKRMLAVFRRMVDSWSRSPPSGRQVAFVSRLIQEALHDAEQSQ